MLFPIGGPLKQSLYL